MHKNLKIYGNVQGVFFRQSAKIKADELGIKGFVKNEPDGSVYIEADGDGEAVERFIDWCRLGPDSANVDKIE
ncbi:MAG TPA: acylphosphatase, partial [Candidatus Paceibacterota bacterium]